ncbi:MAG: hypothetical protein QG614_11 [Patescibacteria group bacterium]|nr:hypothetical protein [Patescibacteria group bacterium]
MKGNKIINGKKIILIMYHFILVWSIFLSPINSYFYGIIRLMQKTVIRILAIAVLISPWLYLGETIRDVMSIVIGIIILLATIDMSKRNNSESL